MKRLVVSLALAGALLNTAAHAQAPVAAPKAAPPASSAEDTARKIALIQTAPVAEQLAKRLAAGGNFASATLAWERAVTLRPHIGRYRLELAAAYAQQDRKRESYNALLELQSQGYAYALKDDERFKKVSTTEVWEYTVKGFDDNRQPFGEGKVAYTLPKDQELIESVAWDATRKKLLVGSARDGKVSIVAADGSLSPLVSADKENGMWSVFDLVVDAERGVLWVASTAVPHFSNYNAETDLGRAGVFKFDLKTGKFLKKFLSPSIAGQAFFLSTIALGKDGEIYAADGVNNAVYQVRDDQFRRLFHAPRLGSIRGLAVSSDGRTLFFGDHERGVLGYDLASGKPFDVGVPKNLALGGIDGVSWFKNELIVVQNSMEPNRVMRLKLSDDRRTITEVQPLAANQPELRFPTLGTVAGEDFYLIANSQKGEYDRFGLAHDKKKLQRTQIYRVPAGFVSADPNPLAKPRAPG